MKRIETLFCLLVITLATYAMDEGSTFVVGNFTYKYARTYSTTKIAYVTNVNQTSGTVTIPATVTYGGDTYEVRGLDAFGNTYEYGRVIHQGVTKVIFEGNVEKVHAQDFPLTMAEVKMPWQQGANPADKGYTKRYCTAYNTIIQIDNDEGLGFEITALSPACNNYTKIDYDFIHLFELSSNGTTVIGNITTIGDHAFSHNSYITKVDLTGSHITHIKDGAFYYCGNITEIILNEGLKKIYSYVFSGTAITTMHLPSTLQEDGIDMYCWRGCLDLAAITCADGCPYRSLDGVLYHSTNPYPDSGVEGSYGLKCYPEGKANLYHGYMMPEWCTMIAYGALHGCNFHHITLSSNVKTIAMDSFNDMSNLESLTIPARVENMDFDNFHGTNNLKYLIMMGENCPNLVYTDPSISYYWPSDVKVVVKEGCISSYNKFPLSNNTIITEMEYTIPSSGIGTFCRDFDVDFSSYSDKPEIYPVGTYDKDTRTFTLDQKVASGGGNSPSIASKYYIPSRTKFKDLSFNGNENGGYYGVIITGTPGKTYKYKIGKYDYMNGVTGDNYLTATARQNKYSGIDPYTNIIRGVTVESEVRPTDGDKTNFIMKGGMLHAIKKNHEDTGVYELAWNKAYVQLPTEDVDFIRYDEEASAKISFVFNLLDENLLLGNDEQSGTTAIKRVELDNQTSIKHMYNLNGQMVSDSYRGIVVRDGRKYVNK